MPSAPIAHALHAKPLLEQGVEHTKAARLHHNKACASRKRARLDHEHVVDEFTDGGLEGGGAGQGAWERLVPRIARLRHEHPPPQQRPALQKSASMSGQVDAKLLTGSGLLACQRLAMPGTVWWVPCRNGNLTCGALQGTCKHCPRGLINQGNIYFSPKPVKHVQAPQRSACVACTALHKTPCIICMGEGSSGASPQTEGLV